MSLPSLLQPFQGDIDSAIQFWKQVAVRDAQVEPLLNLQVLLNAAGREEEGFSVSDSQLELNSRDPRALFNRGYHLLKRGRFHEGFSALENGRSLNTYGNPRLKSAQPLWMGDSSLENKTILLALEGGFGDEFINFRFHRELRKRGARRILVSSRRQSVSFFAKQDGIDSAFETSAAESTHFDCWLPGMSAPLSLGIEAANLDSSPYLKTDHNRDLAWKDYLEKKCQGPGLKVGIRWSGNPQFEHQQFRKFPPDTVLSLTSLPGANFFSFQRDGDRIELPAVVTDLENSLLTWADTASALANMDLVITSCTSIAHLAGAMGLETWVIVPVTPYYIWSMEGERSPWYNNVRLFRQSRFGKWDDVQSRVRAALRDRLKS